jgi:hypothetical protein
MGSLKYMVSILKEVHLMGSNRLLQVQNFLYHIGHFMLMQSSCICCGCIDANVRQMLVCEHQIC